MLKEKQKGGMSMFCTRCGAKIAHGAPSCSSCGQAIPQYPAAIPNYLVQAILATFCCCVPFGIPAIVFAAQVNTKLQVGDVNGALDCSRKAKMWCWIAFGCGLAGGLLYMLLSFFAAMSDM